MAKLVSESTFGVDVAKDQLVIFSWDDESMLSIPNQTEDVHHWLRSLHGPARIAVEPTAHYHLALVDEALNENIDLYLVNPRQLAHYREAVNVRVKSDPTDAWLLARYLVHEGEQLRAFQPQSRKARRLWSLMLRRATVVQSCQRVQQSFKHLSLSIRALVTQFHQLLARVDRQILILIRELGWWVDYQRCLSVPGIGQSTAAALVATFHRCAFASSDAFIAFMGLDVRVRESGCFKGKRKLTKRGEGELRRLLYCASHSARCHDRFGQYHQRQLDKGWSKIAARVALARKLARIAFSLMSHKQTFDPILGMPCKAA